MRALSEFRSEEQDCSQLAEMIVQYTSATELADLLRRDEEKKTVVLDVRDDDFGDLGHINGAINVPAWDMLGSGDVLDAFLAAHLSRDRTERVVVHCLLSMQRGPSVASRLQQRLSQLDSQDLIDPENVFVLKKGFREFWSIFKDDTDLVIRH